MDSHNHYSKSDVPNLRPRLRLLNSLRSDSVDYKVVENLLKPIDGCDGQRMGIVN